MSAELLQTAYVPPEGGEDGVQQTVVGLLHLALPHGVVVQGGLGEGRWGGWVGGDGKVRGGEGE